MKRVGDMKTDPFLLGIVAGMLALLVFAAVSVLMIRQPQPLLPADTPEGAIQRFYAALDKPDYVLAYSFLSNNMAEKPTLDNFIRGNEQRLNATQRESISIKQKTVNGDSTIITVNVSHYYKNSGPYADPNYYTATEVFGLKQEGGTWRIVSLPDDFILFYEKFGA